MTNIALTPDHIRMFGIALLVASVVYFFALWLLKPSEDNSHGAPQNSQGPHSPNFGTVHGAVTIVNHPIPAAIQTEKSPYGSPKPYDLRNSDALLRALQKAANTPPPPPHYSTWDDPPPIRPKPDLSLGSVISRVNVALGPVPAGNLERAKYWNRINFEIADKVVTEHLHTWGRFGKRAIQAIDIQDWKQGIFDHKAQTLHISVAYSGGYDLIDLQFCRAEIDKIWPEPIRTTNDGSPERPV